MNSRRIDEQRASIDIVTFDNKENRKPTPAKPSRAPLNRSTSQPAYSHHRQSVSSITADQGGADELFDLIATLQGHRMDEQRAVLPGSDMNSGASCSSQARKPRQMSLSVNAESVLTKSLEDDKDEFIDNLMMRLAVTGRIEDQRSCLPTDAQLPRKTSASSQDSKY